MWNEDVIIQKCLKNDRKAQCMLYERYAPMLLGASVRFTGNRAEGEDILQEAFVKIFSSLGDFSGKGSLGGWMRKIVINTAITFYHRNKKHREHADVDELKEKYQGSYSCDDCEFTNEEMLNVIAALPPGYRMVFNLYAIEGYKHKEIADELGIDVNTSKSQYSRAKKIIQVKLIELKEEHKTIIINELEQEE
jgi:RNA polymerase sigma factor (sigma-70 family)